MTKKGWPRNQSTGTGGVFRGWCFSRWSYQFFSFVDKRFLWFWGVAWEDGTANMLCGAGGIKEDVRSGRDSCSPLIQGRPDAFYIVLTLF